MIRRIVILMLVAGAVALAARAWVWTVSGRGALLPGLEAARLAVEDLQRRAWWALGWPLPGAPDLTRFSERLAGKGLAPGAPVFIRIFKEEHELELWMKGDGRFVLFATYPVCRYSGVLGPKLRSGDRQAPEGFYTVGRGQLNPKSRWRRAFNVGFPNLFDRGHGRTGSNIMIHGGCSSIGCYAMTNPVIEEIWDLAVAALDGGQKRFAIHIFPFRMTDGRLAAHDAGLWRAFWADLKKAYDLFEATGAPPRIDVCRGRYVARAAAPESDAEALKERCGEAAAAGAAGAAATLR